MSELAHSALGPSGAHRWKVCPGSVKAEALFRERYPNADRSSPYAEEGTRAHALAEKLLLNPHLPEPGDDIDTMSDVEMLRIALRYREYCQAQSTPESITMVEQRVHMPAIHPDCFGTADYATYNPAYQHLHVIDLKYGRGKFVQVENNPQAMMYAEGVRQYLYDQYGHKVRYFTVHIYQPRAMSGENIASWQFTNLQLDDFVTLTQQQALATEVDTDVFNPGDEQCQWCLANPCKAREQQMHELLCAEFEDLDDELAEQVENLPLLSNDALSAWLNKAKTLKSFVAKIEALAFERSMNREKIPGFKLVEGRASYSPTNIAAMEFIVGDALYKTPEVRSRSDLQKQIGTKAFNAISEFYVKHPGKPTLVVDDDPRVTWNEDNDIDTMLDDL